MHSKAEALEHTKKRDTGHQSVSLENKTGDSTVLKIGNSAKVVIKQDMKGRKHKYGFNNNKREKTEKKRVVDDETGDKHELFDTAQTLVSRFLQVSLFFEDEGEIPVESDEIKVQTWSSQHYRNEPVVVVAAPRLQKFSSNSNRNAEVEADAVDTDVQSLNRGFGEEEGLLQVLSSTTSATATNNVLEISVHEAKPAEKESLLVESNDDDDDDDTETEDQDVEGGRTVAQNNDRGKGPPVIGGESSKIDGDEGPDVDKKADEFIAKRIESIKRSRRSARNSSR
ncbi:hypothetical protein JHK87_055281 [Glycine soja]|nr:hypothetical protein JHK87_055281 [Glycine soja]